MQKKLGLAQANSAKPKFGIFSKLNPLKLNRLALNYFQGWLTDKN